MALSDLEALARAVFARPDDELAYAAFEAELSQHTRAEIDAALSAFVPHLVATLAERASVAPLVAAPRPCPQVSLATEPPAPRGPAPSGSVQTVPKPSTNWAGNERTDGAHGVAFRIRSRADALRVVEDVLALPPGPARAILALGVAHSSSAIVVPRGVLVETGWLEQPQWNAIDPENHALVELHRVFELRKDWYNRSVNCENHVVVGAGARVRDVNAALCGTGRALAMLGAYTGQTLVGAICTGTHGSGFSFGPLHTFVRSVQLVGAAGGRSKEYRIEPGQGITNRALYMADNPSVELIQNDEAFRAVLVGLGAFGIVTSVIVATVSAFSLREEHIHMDWAKAKELLAPRDPAGGRPLYLKDTYSAGVLLSPYPWPLHSRDSSGHGAQHAVMSRAWISSTRPTGAADEGPANLPGILTPLLDYVANATRLAPMLLDIVVALSNPHRLVWGRSDAILANSGNLPRGYSVEYAFPVSELPSAPDALFSTMTALADRRRTVLGTASIRFVGGDEAHLSMTEGQDRFFVEILTVAGVTSAQNVFADLQPVALAHNGRPHWGQWWDPAPASVAAILAIYPHLAEWRAQRSAIDAANLFGGQIHGL